MSIRDPKRWRPGWAVLPGETIREAMAEKGWSQMKLARELGFKPSYTSDIIRGRRGISVSVALALEHVFGVSAEFWLSLQQQYDLAVARKARAA